MPPSSNVQPRSVDDQIIIASAKGIARIPLNTNDTGMEALSGTTFTPVPNPIVAIAPDPNKGKLLWAEENSHGVSVYGSDVLQLDRKRRLMTWNHTSWPVRSGKPGENQLDLARSIFLLYGN